MDVLGIILVAVLLAIGARALYAQRSKSPTRKHMRELIRACHNDAAMAERLVFAEMNRQPGLDIGEAARRARQRLLRERAR